VQELPPVGGGAGQPAPVRTASAQPAQTGAPLSDAAPQRLRTATLVEQEPVVTQVPVRRTDIYVQAGAFTQVGNAVRLRARLSSLGNVQIAKALVGEDAFYRVRLGPVANGEEADRMLELLLNNGINDARVVVD